MAGIDYSIIYQDDSPGKVIAIAAVLLALTIGTSVGRAITRSTGNRNWRIDDAFLFSALLIFIAMAILQIIAAADYGLGARSQQDPATGQYITPSNYSQQQKLQFVFNVISVPCNGLTKLALLYFYKRIFIGKPFLIATRVIVAIVIAWTIAFFFAGIFTCTPVSVRWTFGTVESSICATKLQPYFLAFPGSDLVTDVMVLIIPIPGVLKLHMPLKKKLAILAIFLIGVFVVITGAFRLWSLRAIMSISAEAALGGDQVDFYFINTPVWYWNLVECGVAVVCANLVTLGPLFKKLPFESVLVAAVNGLVSLASFSSSRLRRTRRGSSTAQGTSPDKTYVGNNADPRRSSETTSNDDIEMQAGLDFDKTFGQKETSRVEVRAEGNSVGDGEGNTSKDGQNLPRSGILLVQDISVEQQQRKI